MARTDETKASHVIELLAYEDIKQTTEHYPFASRAEALFHMASSRSARTSKLFTDLFTYLASELGERSACASAAERAASPRHSSPFDQQVSSRLSTTPPTFPWSPVISVARQSSMHALAEERRAQPLHEQRKRKAPAQQRNVINYDLHAQEPWWIFRSNCKYPVHLRDELIGLRGRGTPQTPPVAQSSS